MIENTVQDVSLEEVLAEMPTNNEKPEVQNVSALENVEDLQSPSFRSHVEIIQLEPGTSVICDQKNALVPSPTYPKRTFKYDVEFTDDRE